MKTVIINLEVRILDEISALLHWGFFLHPNILCAGLFPIIAVRLTGGQSFPICQRRCDQSPPTQS